MKRATDKSPPVPEAKKMAPSTSSAKKSQQSLLLGAIKRKRCVCALVHGFDHVYRAILVLGIYSREMISIFPDFTIT